MQRIQLGVHHQPPVGNRVPIFSHPVVFIVNGLEISRETTACPGGDALPAQHGNEQESEVPAVPDNFFLNRTVDKQGPGIKLKGARQAFCLRAELQFRSAFRRQGKPIALRPENMNGETLDHPDQFRDGARQILKSSGKGPRIGHPALLAEKGEFVHSGIFLQVIR